MTIRLSAAVTLATALATAALAPLPAKAGLVGLSLCIRGENGQTPGLLLIDGGTHTFVPVGANGLTAAIARNERRARAWAAASGLAADGTHFVNYRDHLCGLPMEEGDAGAAPGAATHDPEMDDYQGPTDANPDNET